MSFKDCISHALNDGVIDRYEAEDLVKRFEALEDEERRGFASYGTAKARLEKELSDEALAKKRRQLLQARASAAIARDVRRFALDHKPDIVEAFLRVFENHGFTGYSSIKNATAALIGAAHAEMDGAIHAFRRSGLTMQRRGQALLEEFGRAAFGESNDPGAQALYNAWRGPADKLRERFNAAGGEIAWRKDWGLPTFHSSGATAAAGFEKWRAFEEPLWAWDKMRHGLSDAPILPAEREAVMRHVWESIVMEGWNTRDPKSVSGRPARWASRSDSRFIVYKNFDAWNAHNRAFGTGDVWATVTSHIRTMARDVALMERLGPSPGATVEWMKRVVEQEGARRKAGHYSLFGGGRIRGIDAAVKSGQNAIDSLYDLSRGFAGGANGPMADAGAIFRNLQYGAKLGGAIITHAVLNPIVQTYARHVHGIPLTAQFMDMARAFTSAGKSEATRAGLIVQDALHVLEQGAREAAAGSRMRQLSAWLPAATVHYSGLEPFVKAQRRAFMFGAMGHFADQVGKSWEALPVQTRRLLEGYGLREPEWAIMRQATLHQPDVGSKPFLRFRDIAGVEHADADRVALRYAELLAGETERAVPSSSWRVRAKMLAGTREDTLIGQAMRSFAMFKGFVGSFAMTHLEAVKQEIARDALHGGAAAAAYLTALTAGGMLVLQLKSLASGKDMRSVDPATHEGRDTWLHSFLISGGLSIYGDFLASDRSAYGHGPLETAAGPVVTGAIDAYTALRSAFETKKATAGQGFAERAAKTVTAGAIGFAKNNTPVLSTHWALRAAYNRVLIDQLQHLTDPDATTKWKRGADRLRKETGQEFYWPRGNLLPARPPAIAGHN